MTCTQRLKTKETAFPLISDDELVRIDLPAEGEWVEVKARVSRGDEIAVRQAWADGARLGSNLALEEMNPATVLEAMEFATLDRVLKRWSFDVPVTPENIRRLDAESMDAIKARLNEIHPGPRGDDEARNSESSGAMQSSVEAESPLHSGGSR